MKKLAFYFLLITAFDAQCKIIYPETGRNSDILSDISIDKPRSQELLTRVSYETKITYKENEKIVRVKEIWHFPTPSDVNNFGKDRFFYNENFEDINIISAATVSSTGEVYTLEKDDFKIMDTNTYDVFSSSKEILISYPRLQPGGYTHLEYEKKVNTSKIETDQFSLTYPQSRFLTEFFKYELEWSNKKPNTQINYDGLHCIKKKKYMKCTGENIPEAKTDHDYLWHDEIDGIQTGNLDNWDLVINKTHKEFSWAYAKDRKFIKNTLSKIIPKESSTEEIINHIHEYSSRNIRYLSRSEYGHAVKPHKTRETLSKKLGDCKDKTALFIDLAREYGINAYPVLVATNRKKVKANTVPSLKLFNHVIACYRLSGKEFCSDLTDSNTHWKNISSWIQGNMALRILPDEKPYLLKKDRYLWQYSIETELNFTENGGQIEKQTREYKNLYSSWLKNELSSRPSTEVDSWLRNTYKDVVAEAENLDISISGLNEILDTVTITSTSEFEPFLDTDEKLIYTENDAWLQDSINSNKIKNNNYGTQFSGYYISSYYKINTSPIWRPLSSPAALNLSHKFGSLSRRIINSKEKDTVEVHTELKIPSTYVTKEDIKEFNNFLKAISSETSIRITAHK
ncbi:MAG: DUF3857 and transglutaminase domain-containing protein [Cellvibrionaceae bacterium]